MKFHLRIPVVLILLSILTFGAYSASEPKIAVIDAIVDKGVDVSTIGPVTESVIERLVASGKYMVLDRAHMTTLLKEQEFQLTGVTDEASAVSAGKILGAAFVVIIKIQKMDSIFYITVKMIDVQTSQIVKQSSDSRETAKLSSLLEMAQTASVRLLGDLPAGTAMAAAASAPTNGSTIGTTAVGTTATGKAPTETASGFRVSFVPSGTDDPFSKMVRRGLAAFAEINGVRLEDVIDISHPASPDVIRAALAKAAESGFALTICAGFNLADTVRKVARTYPAARFGLIDSIVEEPNVVSVLFMEKDVSFLAGVAAGLQAKKDGKTTVGLIAGMDNPVIRRFRAGFVQGVKAVFPTCTILVDFAGAFDRPEKGRWLATTQFDKGAWVIYNVAGISGNGIFQEAIARAERGDRRWVIGVDTDQYQMGVYAPGKSVTLTSAMKRYDVAAHYLARVALENRLPLGKIVTLGVADGGVGLPLLNPNLSPEIAKTVSQYEVRLRDGAITVREEL